MARESYKPKNHYKICVVSAIIVMVFVIAYINISKQLEYNTAVQLYESGNYEQALEYFSSSDYKNAEEYLEKTVEKYVYELINSKNFIKADEYLKMVSNEDIHKELETELIYVRAIENYENGLFENAINLFEEVPNYKESFDYKQKAKTMNGMQGEWIVYGGIAKGFYATFDNKYAGMVISGWNSTIFHCTDFKKTFEEVANSNLFFEESEDGEYIIFRTTEIEYKMYYDYLDLTIETNIVNDSFFEHLDYTHVWNGKKNNTLVFKRPNDSDEVNGATSITTEPKIGMTSEEVRNSAWGEPEKINKTTYLWGTVEQWCYANQKYVYIENGIVTSIQE